VIPRGFTLVEIMMAIVILAILLGIAVPSFRDASLSSRLTGYANDIVASAQVARSEAIKRNARVRLCTSAAGTACEADADWTDGWIVVTAGGEVLRRQASLDDAFSVTEDDDVVEISFPPTVVGVVPAAFTVRRATPAGGPERCVTISSSGSATATRPEDDSCP
jgi:type IV fimbrial biogenesis protein FimT